MYSISVSNKQHATVATSVATTCGARREMEDTHAVELNFADTRTPTPMHYIAIYDGHGGNFSSNWACKNLHNYFRLLPENSKYDIQAAMLAADYRLCCEIAERGAKRPENSGCTVAAVLVKPTNTGLWRVNTINAGDSRVLVITQGAVLSTTDHKPDDVTEELRIQAAGGSVVRGKCARIQGRCAVSRSLGALGYKQNRDKSPSEQMIIAVPDVTLHIVERSTRIIIACDGLFERLTNEEVAAYVRKQSSAADAARGLVDLGIKSGSTDNISVAAIWLDTEEEDLPPTRPVSPELTAPANTPECAFDYFSAPRD